MSDAADAAELFRFVQVELPWRLGPDDGRYLVRDAEEDEPVAILVLRTLGAPERRRLPRLGQRRPRAAPAAPRPDPTPVPTTRATVIVTDRPLSGPEPAVRWLGGLGADGAAEAAEDGLAVLNRALAAQRAATQDPYVREVELGQALVVRVGFGTGAQLAEGRWTDAVEPPSPGGGRGRRRRVRALAPQERLAAILGAREIVGPAEELALRARLDLDQGRERTAALQLGVALDAALAELGGDGALTNRVEELRGLRPDVQAAAAAALAGDVPAEARVTVGAALERLEATLRARAASRVSG